MVSTSMWKIMAKFLLVGGHVAAGHLTDSGIAVRSWEEANTVVEGSWRHMLARYWAVVVGTHLVGLVCHDMQQGKRFHVLGPVVVADS